MRKIKCVISAAVLVLSPCVFAKQASKALPAKDIQEVKSEDAVPNWGKTNISFLTGSTYEQGEAHANTLMIENTRSWSYGDSYLFFEITHPTTKNTFIYGEWHPYLSLSKLLSRPVGVGRIKDVQVAGQLNYNGAGTHVFLYGIGLVLDVPHFTFVRFNTYVRRNPLYSGSAYQITMAWGLPLHVPNTRWSFTFGGFFDYAGNQGQSVTNFLAKPFVVFDLGKVLGHQPNNLFLGVRYVYWHNKLGIKGVTESVPELMLTWQLS